MLSETVDLAITLNATGDPDRALDVIFDAVDEDLSRGGAETRTMLRTVDVDRLDELLIVAILSITRCARSYARSSFVERAIPRLRRLAPDRIDSLTRGLL